MATSGGNSPSEARRRGEQSRERAGSAIKSKAARPAARSTPRAARSGSPSKARRPSARPAAAAQDLSQAPRGTLARVLNAATGPALAAGAAAVGFAGGAALMRRRQRRRVLGIELPRSLVRMTSKDGASFVKQVGRATRQVGQTSKGLSKDLNRFGEQAERIGKYLE